MGNGIGINCKIWAVKGSSVAKKGAIDNIRDSIIYITNKEKTMANGAMDPLNQLHRECKYVENDLKTFEGAYVGGNNVSSPKAEDAVAEMMEIKRFYGKENGRAAAHMVISLPEDESGIQNASRLLILCDHVVKEVFPNYQAIYAIHTNTDNLHAHVIINTVGLDGKKIHEDNSFVREVLHPCINKYASVYGFSQNQKWKTFSFVGKKINLRQEIDQAIEQSNTFEDFVKVLQKKDISVRTGKYISLALPEMKKAIRTHQLGPNYTRDAIVERIRTRKEEFHQSVAHDYVLKDKDKYGMDPILRKMPKYQDMTPVQKKEVIHLLRLGKNPWRENQKRNWQLNRIADDLNAMERIRSYIEFYSPDYRVESALAGMLEAKKKVANERKQITALRRRYKPILDIYQEMKEIEKKAYLYEYQGVAKYRLEFEQYRQLTERLKNGYGKDVMEVAAFLEKCEEQYLYAKAQEKELSDEYRELKKYATSRGMIKETNDQGLLDLIGYYKDKENAKMRVTSGDAFYIACDNAGVVLQVIKSPSTDRYGNVTQEYEIKVLGRDRRVLRSFSGSGQRFCEEIYQLQKKYGLKDGKKYQSFQAACEYSKARVWTEEYDQQVPEADESLERYTFAQAINHVTDQRPNRVVVNASNPSYLALSTRDGNNLRVTIFDRLNRAKETFEIPLVQDKNSFGFEEIKKMMEKYDFQGDVVEFNTLDEAKNYRIKREKQLSAKLAESARGKNQ